MADDTFFGSGDKSADHTVVKPRPGARSRQPQQQPIPPSRPAGRVSPVAGIERDARNPILSAAVPLLTLAGQLGNTRSHPSTQDLYQSVVRELQAFEQATRSAGVPNESVITARYALCTLFDEVVLNTPWGRETEWTSQTLLTYFHKEAWGGEKFFQALQLMLDQPLTNLDLLEFMYACLAMGLKGQYRARDNGDAQLEAVKAETYRALRTYRGEVEWELSPNWRGEVDATSPLAKSLSLWVVASVALGIAVLGYFAFAWMLNTESDPVAGRIAALGRDVPPIVERQAFMPVERTTLQDLLANEVRSGALSIAQTYGRETVTVRSLFASGSAQPSPQAIQLLDRIGSALSRLPGQVLIEGHTDNVPTRTLRYPSNWHLSRDRANAVKMLLAPAVGSDRLRAEARADSQPLVNNDSANNRAMNRRVEVTLFSAPGRE